MHIDDLLRTFLSKEAETAEVQAILAYLTIEERGQPTRFLGMDWKWVAGQLHVSGRMAIEELARDYQITKSASSPFTTKFQPETPVDTKNFQTLTGRLLFITRMWRPDIRYAVQRLCVKTKTPTQQDWAKGLRIVAYLLRAASEGIVLGPEAHQPVNIFTDAGEEKLEERATSGILTRIGRSPVSWAARMQDVTTLSSTEAEYIALSMGVQDGMWVGKVLEFLNVRDVGVPRIWTDNKGAATLTKNPNFYRRTMHIRRRHHFIRECAGEGRVVVGWVPGSETLADALTKVVAGPRLNELKMALGMKE